MVMKEISSSYGMGVDSCVGDSESLRAGIEFENSSVRIRCRKCSLVLFGVVPAVFLSLQSFGKRNRNVAIVGEWVLCWQTFDR